MLKGKKYNKILLLIIQEFMRTEDFETTYMNTESLREQLNSYICRDYFRVNNNEYDPSLLNETMCVMFVDGFRGKQSMYETLKNQDNPLMRMTGMFNKVLYFQICAQIKYHNVNIKHRVMHNYLQFKMEDMEERYGIEEEDYDDIEMKILLEEFYKYLKNDNYKRILKTLMYYKYEHKSNGEQVKQSDIAEALGTTQSCLSIACRNMHVHFIKFMNGIPSNIILSDSVKQKYGIKEVKSYKKKKYATK